MLQMYKIPTVNGTALLITMQLIDIAIMLRTALFSGQSRQLSWGLHHTRISTMYLTLEQMNFSYIFADFATLKATKTFLCTFFIYLFPEVFT
jgi:acyl-homoserine lactone acylase PvdQ